MFDLSPDEELDLLRETTIRYAEEELVPNIRDFENDRRVSEKVRRSYELIGLAGLEVPESLGGAGLGSLARVLVNEKLAAADPGAALGLDPLGPALYAFSEFGGDEATQEFGLPILDGAGQGARAVLVTEHDATLEVDGETISGHVPWIPSSKVDLLVILSSDGAKLIREGFVLESVRGSGLRAAGASEIYLDRAPIMFSWKDETAAARTLARARLYFASLLLGVLHQACESSRKYALERVAFGKPIAHHQALAFLITDMRMAVDGARMLLQEAAWRVDREMSSAEAVSASAYVEVIEASRFIGPNGVQILGGHGFMQDYPLEKYMREARALGLCLGGLDPARDAAGLSLCSESVPIALSPTETT